MDADPRGAGSGGDAGSAGAATGGTSGAPSTGGTSSTGGTGGTGVAGTSGRPDAGVDSGRDAGRDAAVPPECPDVTAPPPFDSACDPFRQTGCANGEACRPYVIYPAGPCEFERYGTTCALAGRQTQGEPCGTNEQRCAAGYSCLKTGQGLQCGQLCPVEGVSACPAGLVCMPLDIGGVGACF